MKSYVKLLLTDTKRFRYHDANNIEMGILGCFLTSDIGCLGIESYKGWFLDPTQDSTIGNITVIEKENDTVILSDLFSEQPDKGPYFRVPLRAILHLLDEWEKICTQKPKEVLIEWDGNHFIVETKS